MKEIKDIDTTALEVIVGYTCPVEGEFTYLKIEGVPVGKQGVECSICGQHHSLNLNDRLYDDFLGYAEMMSDDNER